VSWDKVVIADIWGPGTSHLAAPNGGDLKFTLVPRYTQDAKGKPSSDPSDYAVTLNSGEAPAEWAGAIFTPMGTAAVTGICDLPDWDKSKPAIRKAYRTAIDDSEMNNLGSGSTQRLESIIPYVSDTGALAFNYVRLFRVEKARGKPTTHLFVIKAVAAALPKGTVRALQDGSGHGPPS
jgi:hypothetical protein